MASSTRLAAPPRLRPAHPCRCPRVVSSLQGKVKKERRAVLASTAIVPPPQSDAEVAASAASPSAPTVPGVMKGVRACLRTVDIWRPACVGCLHLRLRLYPGPRVRACWAGVSAPNPKECFGVCCVCVRPPGAAARRSQLDNGDAEVRANACAGIASLLCVEGPEMDSNLRRLVSAGVVRKLVVRVSDPAPAVVLHALGALRCVMCCSARAPSPPPTMCSRGVCKLVRVCPHRCSTHPSVAAPSAHLHLAKLRPPPPTPCPLSRYPTSRRPPSCPVTWQSRVVQTYASA
jgi:hypothetical protein